MQKPIRIFGDAIDGKAISQFHDAMRQDYAMRGALMPDAHLGYSLPIGAVIATEGVVVPGWVGYDIGCGMSALPLPVDAASLAARREALRDALYRSIPTGQGVNGPAVHPLTDPGLRIADLSEAAQGIAQEGNRHWMRALGSLGGGNHFIELGIDGTGQAWAIIHSGSRGTGHGIAAHHMGVAAAEGGKRAGEGHPGLRVDCADGEEYLNDQQWACTFALANRREMMHRVVRTAASVVGLYGEPDWSAFINRNHNHVEAKDGVWVHRKGATHAEAGMLGVIPGNMRDGSFIVRGKGNPESLCSSSHGAGRVLSRRQAKETLDLEEFRREMEEAGIAARVEPDTLDESRRAYKDIFSVMDAQRDLIEVLLHVRPVVNIKG